MLSLAKITRGSWRYYQQQVAGGLEYYTRGEAEAPGVWYGRGLEALGLTPGTVVTEQQLEAMFTRALHPDTGEALGRTWRSDGVTGFDLCFSAPKSVSALWALADADTHAAIWAAHRAAVRAGLDYLDTHAGLSRRGRDGVDQIDSAGFAVACFDHRTSRLGDPQVHTHALVMNKLDCPDGRWRSIDGHELYHHKKSAGVIYQAALRAELHNRLGVGFDAANDDGQADIAGVPRALLAVWSKRTADIEQEAGPKITEYEAALGRPLSAAERAKVVQTAVLKTRPVKQVEDAVTLHGRWHSEAACCGYSPGQLLDAVHAAAHTIAPGLPEEELVPAAVSAAGRRRAAFSRADVAAEIAARLPVTTATAGQVREQVERLTDAALAHRDVVGLGQLPDGVTRRRSDPRYATRELLAAEARVLAAADTGRAADLATVDPATAQAVAAAASLDADQQAAVVRLTGSGALLEVLTAPAGAGKTTTLGATAAAWRQAGLRVLGLAPTARAAAELAAATGGPTDTLAKWAHEHARGHRWLTPGLAVVVDEASRADTFTLDALIGTARSVGAKVVLVGDPAQPGVINGPGGLLGLLADRGHGITLTGVRRFAEPWERAASLHLRAGDPVAMLRYAEHDRIHPATSRVDALDAVFTRWAAAVAASTDALMLTRTRVDANALNTRARTAAIDTGAITGPTVRLGGTDWQAGDLLRTRRNDRRLPIGETHVRNGDRFQVVAVAADGLDVDDLTGRGRAWLPAGYVARHAAYGWASTIDTAQGTTADIGILYAEPGLDREHLYVGLTRGRAANHVHVNTIPTDTETHHLPIRGGATLADAIGVLTRAQARIGAEPAAHTAADRAARSRQHEPAPQRLSHTEFVEQLRALNADLARLTALLARRSCQPTAEYDHHRSTGLTPDRSPDRGMSR